MKSTLVVLLVILALSKSLEIFESSTPQPSCCHKCPDGLIKTYSIIEERGNCGESCIQEKYYWFYKIFEPKMQKADAPDQQICQEKGYVNYRFSETHGVPHVFTVDVDFWRKD